MSSTLVLPGQSNAGSQSQMEEAPFIYVFNATGLTDGLDYRDAVINLDGISDFFLRRIVGVPSVCGSFNIKDDANHQPLAWSPSGRGMILQNNYAMAQSWRYRKDGHIYFDLFNVARANFACGGQPVYTSYIGLQGANSVPRSSLYTTSYDFAGFPYSLEATLTLNWYRYTSGVGAILDVPRQFYIEILNYDFELQQINVVNVTNPAAPFVPTTTDFKMQLFDTYGNKMSNESVPLDFVNHLRGGGYSSIFPVPTTVYQRNSQLRFDIVSMLCFSATTQVYNISFKGMRRIPT